MKYLLACFLFCLPCWASLSTVYVGQSSAGGDTGANCANQHAITFLTTFGNWGSGSSQIGPDSTVHLCGTITTQFPVSNDGTSGHPITIVFESSAKLSVPYCLSSGGANPSGCIDFQGNDYIVIDGGVACGPGTACSTNDTGTGIIEATANGTNLANQIENTVGIAMNNCTGCEIKNLIIRNLYVHVAGADSAGGSNLAIAMSQGGITNCSFHDMTVHDIYAGIYSVGNADTNVSVYRNYIYNVNWGTYRGTSLGNTQTNWAIYDNHFGSVANWDDTSGANQHHHDRVFMADGVAGQGNFDGVYIYNNLFDGTSGTRSTAMIYWGGGSQINAYVYNNVFDDTSGVNSMNALLELTGGSATSVWVYNNIIMGFSTTSEAVCVQLEGTARFFNNAVTGCDALLQNKSGITYTGDYNVYGAGGAAHTWQSGSGSTSYTTIAAWRTFTGQEANSSKVSDIGVNSSGVPQSGSALIGAGTNLTGSCSGSVTALCSDTTAGNTRSAVARPSSGAWDSGAYQFAAAATPGPRMSQGGRYLRGGRTN